MFLLAWKIVSDVKKYIVIYPPISNAPALHLLFRSIPGLIQSFQIAYKLEVENTERIHKAFALAVQQKDYPTEIFLQWFINEQVEEEDNCQTMIGALELAKDCSSSLLALDREATQR